MGLKRSGAAMRRLGLVASTAVALAANPLTAHGGTTFYQYDAMGRLVATSTPSAGVTYVYDAAGNRVQQGIGTGLPIVGPVSTTVAANSTNNAIPLALTQGGGAATSVAVTTQAVHGAAIASGTSITYTPSNGYVGSDSFQYNASNASGVSASQMATITITSQIPTVGTVSKTVAFNSDSNAIPLPLNLTPGIATPTSVAIATPAAHGTAAASGLAIAYTPAVGYFGSDSFTYTASNSGGASAPALVSITVNPAAPVASAVNMVIGQNSSSNVIIPTLSGGAATSFAVTSPAHGSSAVTGTTILYTPFTSFTGHDSFTYTASNAGGTSQAGTVLITVKLLPPAAGVVSQTVPYNSSNNVITPNLSGGAATSFAVTSPAHGSSAVSGSTFLYTPTAAYSGADSFTYTATNAAGTSAPGTVSITVNPAPPVANATSAGVAMNSSNTPISLNLSGGAASSVTVTTQAAHGTATASGATISYTPVASYSGADSFQYTATNATATSAPATVGITVNSTNHPPVANPDSFTITKLHTQGQSYCPTGTVNVTANDTDPDGNALTLTSTTAAAHGTTAVVNASTAQYNSTQCTTGTLSTTETFTYTISDGHGGTATGTVTVTIDVETNG